MSKAPHVTILSPSLGYKNVKRQLTKLEAYLVENDSPRDLARVLLAIAKSSLVVRDQLPFSTSLTKNVNTSGEKQTEIDIFANDAFTSSLLGTGSVAEVVSEEMADAKKGTGRVHVAMDPLDGSSNISTNNPLGSIFGFYSEALPCSGTSLTGAAFVTYGPMLTLTFSTGGRVASFAAINDTAGADFMLLEEDLKIPDKPEVYGLGGLRKDWIEPVERFVSSLESRGLKLRYGGTFVGDYNQVLRYGGMFGYPSLKNKPKGKLRVLYEVAPMAYITKQCGGYASDGHGDALLVKPSSLEDSTPIYLGSRTLVMELETLIRATGPGS
jgi:fructose-1,6-bisphosphatase I